MTALRQMGLFTSQPCHLEALEVMREKATRYA